MVFMKLGLAFMICSLIPVLGSNMRHIFYFKEGYNEQGKCSAKDRGIRAS